jgi:hypothetical protein
MWDQEDPVPRTWCFALGLVDIATWQPILVQRSRETWELPRTPYLLSALLKYTLQIINYDIAAWHNLRSCCYSLLKHPRTESKAPLLLDCSRWLHGHSTCRPRNSLQSSQHNGVSHLQVSWKAQGMKVTPWQAKQRKFSSHVVRQVLHHTLQVQFLSPPDGLCRIQRKGPDIWILRSPFCLSQGNIGATGCHNEWHVSAKP